MSREVLKVKKYTKWGYEVRTVKIDERDYGCNSFEMDSAYTLSGDYIGNPKDAAVLCEKKGIKPEKSNSKDCVCSIGFCEKESKWYGWSHRAICGFTVGSEVKEGHCAYYPSNKQEFLGAMKRWFKDTGVKFKEMKTGVKVIYNFSKEEMSKSYITGCFEKYPKVWGRGEWEAKILEDAKQMAIDFARSVS